MGYTVSLVSTYPCEPIANLERLSILPVAFAGLMGAAGKGAQGSGGTGRSIKKYLRRRMDYFRGIFLTGRYIFGPLSVQSVTNVNKFRQVVESIQPDLVHALRIPFEGMLASFVQPEIPLILSIWGNDLTLHTHGSSWMARLTRSSLKAARGLMADTQRDITLASDWGFDARKPSLVVPGSGGLELAKIAQANQQVEEWLTQPLPAGARLLVNPRGYRPGSLRNDTFFKAIPEVIKKVPDAIFLCPSMTGQADAVHWVKKLGIQGAVRLLPNLSQVQLWSLFHRTEIFISPSVHDGTPNSFLEALACGCFPVVGNIESFREWIEPGSNGLLIDATDPHDLAEGMLKALASADLREKAKEINSELIGDRADARQVRQKVALFYNLFVRG